MALFICSRNGKKWHSRFTETCEVYGVRNNSFKFQNLPPSERATHFHDLPFHLQVCKWSNLDLEWLNLFVWSWYQIKETLGPIKTDLEVGPIDMLNFTWCNCKTSTKKSMQFTFVFAVDCSPAVIVGEISVATHSKSKWTLKKGIDRNIFDISEQWSYTKSSHI